MNDVVEKDTSAKASAETVSMTDGRKVEFAGKRKMLKESIFTSGEPPTVRLDFRNGETRSFRIPEGLVDRFAAHGAEQKLGDETAGETDVDDMVMSIDELTERLHKGEWSTRREGGGMSGTSVLLKALVEFSGRTVDQVKEFLKSKTQLEKTALRSADMVNGSGVTLKSIVQRLESEKEAKSSKVDTGALLASL